MDVILLSLSEQPFTHYAGVERGAGRPCARSFIGHKNTGGGWRVAFLLWVPFCEGRLRWLAASRQGLLVVEHLQQKSVCIEHGLHDHPG